MKRRIALLGSMILIVSVVLTSTPVVACHNQTVACDGVQTSQGGVTIEPPSRTVEPGASTEYHITMTLSPGCGGTYYLYASLGTVPAGWRATYMSGPGQTGTDYSNIDNVQCGQGNNVVIHAYLNVTAPVQSMEGDTAVITVMIGADDNARNDKRLVYVKTTTKVHINDPIPQVVNPLKGFSMPEDTTDDTHINMSGVFRDPDNDQMSFGVETPTNFAVSVFLTGRTVLKPKQDWNGQETLNFWGFDGNTKVPTSVTVTVTAVADPPVLAMPMKDFAIPQDGQDDGTINLNKVFFDADTPYDDHLAFGFSGNEKINVSIKADSKVCFKPLAGWSGEETIEFTAADEKGTSVRDDVKVTVTNSAKPPYVKAPIKDISFPEDTIYDALDLSQVFATPNLISVLTYGYMGSTQFNVTISTEGKVTLTPVKYWHGTETITFWGSDGMFMPVFTDAKVTVVHVNHPPFQKKELSIAFDEDTPSPTAYLELHFGDWDQDTLSYSMRSTDELTVTIYQRTAELHISSALNYNGAQTLTLIVSDGLVDISVKVPVTVRPLDDTPQIIDWLPGGNYVCNEGDEVSLSVNAIDFDGAALTYLWWVDENNTPLKSFDGKNSIKFRATSDRGLTPGTHEVKVYATKQTTDGSGWIRDNHCWKVTVNFGNRPPSVPVIRSPVPTNSYTTGGEVSFDAMAEDLDKDPISWVWYIDGQQVSTMQKFAMKLTAGAHKVKVTACDNKAPAVSSEELNITVANPPPAEEKKGAPGFEALALVAAIGAVLVLLRRKK